MLSEVANAGTIISAVVATVAVIVAIVEYRRRKAQDAENNRPYVVVDIEPAEVATNLFNVVINNIGNMSAKNIKIRFSPNQQMNIGSRSNKINDLKILRNLHFLPPNKPISFFFGSYMDIEPMTTIRRKYKITVQYESVGGVKYAEILYRDPREMDDLTRIGIKTLHDGVKVLEKLRYEQESLRKSQERLTMAIVENGVSIRNSPLSDDPIEDVRAVARLYQTHSKNEMWLNHLIYDFYIQIKRARDGLLRINTLTDAQKAILSELNALLSIHTSQWGIEEDGVARHFEELVALTIDNNKITTPRSS